MEVSLENLVRTVVPLRICTEVIVPYASGEVPVVGDYVKNQWEQPGTVTQVYASEAGQEQVSIRWDDGGADLPLTPAEEFTLISGHAAQSKNLP